MKAKQVTNGLPEKKKKAMLKLVSISFWILEVKSLDIKGQISN